MNSAVNRKFNRSVQALMNSSDSDIDLNADFVSEASYKAKTRMKKATYEMDQLVANQFFAADPVKMGLSLYYHEQEAEQRRILYDQQQKLLQSLKILFGGETKSTEYVNMAKNLTKKL